MSIEQEALMPEDERIETVRFLFQSRCGKDFATFGNPFAPTEAEATEFLSAVPPGRTGLGIVAQAFSNVEVFLRKEKAKLVFYAQDEVIDLVQMAIAKEFAKHDNQIAPTRTLYMNDAAA
jgi:hypothetical protein